MIRITISLENLTTDEPEVILTLPIAEPELKSILMPDCEYLITEIEDDRLSPLNTDANCDVFILNKYLNRLGDERPEIDNDIMAYILEAADMTYNADIEDLVEKLCNNDFMYCEVDVPRHQLGLTREEYAAKYLYEKLKIPFFPQGKGYTIADFDWDGAWSAYEFMGFYVAEDPVDIGKLYIINLSDAEE